MHMTWTYPHICLQERVAQIIYKMPQYTRRKLHLHFLTARETQKRVSDMSVSHKMFAFMSKRVDIHPSDVDFYSMKLWGHRC